MRAQDIVNNHHTVTINQEELLADFSPEEREGIQHLIAFDTVAHEIAWRQISEDSFAFHAQLPDVPALAAYKQAVEMYFDTYDEEGNHFSPDVSREEFAALTSPSLEERAFDDTPRPEGLNIYPKHFTQEDADKHPDSFTIIREQDGGSLTSIPFEEAYADILERALPHYDAAIDSFRKAGHGDFAEYLLASRDAITTTPENPEERNLPWSLNWIQYVQKNPRIDHVAGFIENYAEFKKRCMWQADVLVETEQSRVLNDLLSDIAPFESQLPYAPVIRSGNVPNPTVRFMDVVHRTGFGCYSAHALANMLPNDTQVLDEYGAVTTMFTNMLAAKQEAILKPLIRGLVPDTVLKEYDAEVTLHDAGTPNFSSEHIDKLLTLSFQVGCAAHEATHFLSKQTERNEQKEKLGNDVNFWEEGRAEAGRLYFQPQFIRQAIEGIGWDVNPDEAIDFAYRTEIAEMVRHLRFGKKSPYAQAAAHRLAYFLDSGALTLDEGKFSVNKEQMEQDITDIFVTHLKVIGECDLDAAQDYKKRFGTQEQLWEELVEQTNYVPKDIFVKYV